MSSICQKQYLKQITFPYSSGSIVYIDALTLRNSLPFKYFGMIDIMLASEIFLI